MTNNEAVLMEGGLFPLERGVVHAVLKSYRDGKAIVGVYNDMLVSLSDRPYVELDLVNAKGSDVIELDLCSDIGDVEVTTYDTRGRVVQRESRHITSGVHRFDVPASGVVNIKRQE